MHIPLHWSKKATRPGRLSSACNIVPKHYWQKTSPLSTHLCITTLNPRNPNQCSAQPQLGQTLLETRGGMHTCLEDCPWPREVSDPVTSTIRIKRSPRTELSGQCLPIPASLQYLLSPTAFCSSIGCRPYLVSTHIVLRHKWCP